MRNSADLSGRPCSAGEPLRPRETDGDVRTFTVKRQESAELLEMRRFPLADQKFLSIDRVTFEYLRSDSRR